MTEKKGFFGFLKGWSGSEELSEEEKQQRDYALAKEKEETSSSQKTEKKRNGYFSVGNDEAISEEIELFCVEKLESLLQLTGLSGKAKARVEKSNRLTIELFDTGDDTGKIIGKSGATLEAIQILLKSFVIRKFQRSVFINLDVEDYRSRRKSQVKSAAISAAQKLKSGSKSVKLDPMSSAERKEVHLLFESDEQVQTMSEGAGDRRHVVLLKPDSDPA